MNPTLTLKIEKRLHHGHVVWDVSVCPNNRVPMLLTQSDGHDFVRWLRPRLTVSYLRLITEEFLQVRPTEEAQDDRDPG